MNYDKKIERAKKNYVYVSTSVEGKKEADFVPVESLPIIKQLLADYKLLKSWFEALGFVSDELLNKLEISGSKHLHGNTKKILDNTELVIKDKQDYAFELVGGYISKFMKITDIYRGELPKDLLNGYYMLDNGQLVKDKEKEAEYLASIGG